MALPHGVSSTVLLVVCSVAAAIQVRPENALLDLNDQLIKLVLRRGANEVVSPAVIYRVLEAAHQAGDNKVRNTIQHVLGTDRPERISQQLDLLADGEPAVESFFRAYTTPRLSSECAPGRLTSLSKRERCGRLVSLLERHGQNLNLSAPAALQRINADVADATGGLIRNLFTFLDPQARMVLVSALTLSAEWLPDLAAAATGMQFFSGPGREPVRVPAVQTTASLRYLADGGDGVTGAALPYYDRGLHLEMFFFVAEPLSANITHLLNRQHYERLADASPLDAQVSITFPMFKLSSKKHDYLDVVRSLGLSAILEGGLGPDGGDKVDQLVHKAVIDVDEHGTRAAGAAGASIIPRVGADESATKIPLLVNRPFVASVMHVGQLLPLFTAHVSEPLLD